MWGLSALEGARDRKAMLMMVLMMTMMMTVTKRGDLQMWDVTRWPRDLSRNVISTFSRIWPLPKFRGHSGNKGCSDLPGTALVRI